MGRLRTALALALTGLLLNACAGVDYIADSEARVKAADWSRMQNASVVMQEYSYQPETLRFKAGVPYKLELLNSGKSKHYFTAPEFFKAIASRKVQSNADGEVKAPYFSALEVYPGRSLDLYFIAVTPGRYKLHCTIPGHEEQGMHGSIVIE